MARTLDMETGDLAFADGRLVLATGRRAVTQHIRQRLLTFEGEWFLDAQAGVPWLPGLLGGRLDGVLVRSTARAEILDTPDVIGVDMAAVAVDARARTVRLTASDITFREGLA